MQYALRLRFPFDANGALRRPVRILGITAGRLANVIFVGLQHWNRLLIATAVCARAFPPTVGDRREQVLLAVIGRRRLLCQMSFVHVRIETLLFVDTFERHLFRAKMGRLRGKVCEDEFYDFTQEMKSKEPEVTARSTAAAICCQSPILAVHHT